MIFEKECLSFAILDVLELDQENVNIYNKGRNFTALSFRLRADTVIATATEEYHLRDNYVSLVPSRLDYRRIAKKDKLIVIHFELSNYRAERIEAFAPKQPEKIEALFREILLCWSNKEVGYKLEASAILYSILAECYRQNFQKGSRDSKIQKSVDFINRHYTDPDLSICEVAKQSYMSEVYFRKLYKNEFGISPQKHIVHLRIQHAIGLLATGYHTLKEVAYLSGFTDYKYFTVTFKKETGISPSKYTYNYSGRNKHPPV